MTRLDRAAGNVEDELETTLVEVLRYLPHIVNKHRVADHHDHGDSYNDEHT